MAALAAALAAMAALAAAPLLAAQWADAESPDRPTGLTADDISPTRISLAWSAPEDDGGEEITGYKIERKEAGRKFVTIESDTDSADTTYEDDGVKTGTVYVYRVSAINDDGQGRPSSEATGKTSTSSEPPDRVEPERPKSLEADDVSDSEVRLEWKRPDDNNSPPITGYRIEYKEAGDSKFKVARADTKSRSTAYTVDGLDEDEEYVFRVSAINSVGTGEPSGEARATPSKDSKGTRSVRPNAPSGVSAVPTSDTSLLVAWKAPRSGDGPPITGYLVEYRQKVGGYKVAAEVGPDSTALAHSVPNPQTSYSYRVSARNDVGLGPPSSESAFAKPEHTTEPTQVTATALSPTSVRIDWIPPSQTFGLSIGGYSILPVFSNSVEGDPIGKAGGRDTSAEIGDLETGREHRFVVKARIGSSSASSDVVSITLTGESGKGATEGPAVAVAPQAPSNTRAAARSDTQIDVTWDMPSPQGGPTVTGYRVEFKESSSGGFEVATADTRAASRSYSHTGLPAETEYTYRVYAVSGQVVGPPSEEATAKTLKKAAGMPAGRESQAGASGQAEPLGAAPSPPRSLAADRVSMRQIDLSWSEPRTGAGGIESYEIEYSTDGGPFEALARVGAETTRYSHTGIDQDASYSYRVYAAGESGQSAASNTAAAAAAAATDAPDAAVQELAPGLAGGQGGDPLNRMPGFPDPTVGADAYIYLYETDKEFREFFDEVFPEYEITDIVGEPGTGAAGSGQGPGAAGQSPLDRVPGFPDPDTSAREYVDRYGSDPAFKEWFDTVFPEYEITDVVGEPGPKPVPPPPAPQQRASAPPPPKEPDRLPYYNDRYSAEAPYRAWFDGYFHGRSLAEVAAAADRQYGECGSGTFLKDGICQVAIAAGQ